MKNFVIGVVVGIVLTVSGGYTYLANKAKKVATKENAEKVMDAGISLVETVQDTLK